MKSLLNLLILFLISFPILGQEVSGKILSSNNSPVEGAYLLHTESNTHALSNQLGQFSIRNIPKGDSLLIIHIGYEDRYHLVEDLSKEQTIELTESSIQLGEIVVGQSTKRVNVVAAFDIRTNPVSSSQDILRSVPGLFIGQHAGGGKAEQIFLRGFDIDHGTDIALSVDGMPVNMVSHAHGQGYADLHFLIPETIEKIDFGKGPYYANQGNFSTAGYVGFKTKDKLDQSELSIEAGRFNSYRSTLMLKMLDSKKHHIYLASEYKVSDGPFESSQNFSRSNFMTKYVGELPDASRLSIIASHFNSKWTASGQIPQRLVDDGTISRFGAVDDTEGGETGRTNIIVNYTKPLNNNSFIKNNLYYSLYDFELFSNFTFFLNDPVNGDQIKQKEKRQLAGLESSWNKSFFLKNVDMLLEIGVGFRADQVNDNELSRTLNRRTTLEQLQLGVVDERNHYGFVKTEIDYGRWLFQPAIRLDYFKFSYNDNLDSLFSTQSTSKSTVSPKLNIIYNLKRNLQLFFKTGIGFHSNDSRVVLQNSTNAILPKAYGADIGTIFKPGKKMIINTALWYLDSEQEFVYVGDEGIVEPSGRSRRMGIDLSLRYQLNKWLRISGDANYVFARSAEEVSGQDYIPLAPVLTATGAINYKMKKAAIGISSRFLGDRPANEDNSIVANGYFITDLSASYELKKITLGLVIENLFNQEWNETQFATNTRLDYEDEPVEEIHFTPGTPFFIKGILKYRF